MQYDSRSCYCWLRCFHTLFPLVVGRPLLPGFMQVLDKITRCPFMQRQTSWSRQSRNAGVRAVLGQVYGRAVGVQRQVLS